jgi:hypothetical protein
LNALPIREASPYERGVIHLTSTITGGKKTWLKDSKLGLSRNRWRQKCSEATGGDHPHRRQEGDDAARTCGGAGLQADRDRHYREAVRRRRTEGGGVASRHQTQSAYPRLGGTTIAALIDRVSSGQSYVGDWQAFLQRARNCAASKFKALDSSTPNKYRADNSQLWQFTIAIIGKSSARKNYRTPVNTFGTWGHSGDAPLQADRDRPYRAVIRRAGGQQAAEQKHQRKLSAERGVVQRRKGPPPSLKGPEMEAPV